MNIKVVCVGKLKEKYWNEALSEYRKRLNNYCTLSIDELKEERLPDHASEAHKKAVIESEGRRILEKLKSGTYVIALDVKGDSFSSEALAEKMEHLSIKGSSNIVFIIGGSLGLSKAILSRADLKLSFSKMTFPHQMMRVILLEQLYRSFKINKNEAYHK